MTRTAAAVIASAALAGCGSSSERSAPAPPTLPTKLAADLAQRSDQVAATLDAGDACRALDEAQHLQQDTIRLINEGRVPGAFQEHLQAAVGDLVARIDCAPPAHGKGKGHGKHKGKHGEGD